MPSIRSTISQLQRDFPLYHFEPADEFWWSATKKTIYYDPKATDSLAFTLHELSHAVLDHEGYQRDIELLKLERDAWNYAKTTLSPLYGIGIKDDTIQDNLDTYRRWLHARSTCPECETTGIQSRGPVYRCLACGHRWQVNEARLCSLRRYSLQTK
ncbi:MAG: hypothetical protein JWO07_802 [Candidatus Saccharibacteria bacterium]|nr:hypothetical protein [Candidatus Saccharibacteria bacterium]